MQAGRLNRRVVIERKTITRDSDFGSELVAWETYAERWAEVRDINAVERVSGPLRTVTRVTMVTVRWVDGLTADMRLRCVDDGRLLAITSIAELRRREGQQLVCEEYSV